MTVSNKQIEAILKLPPPQRYSHFIKKVVGWKAMWGLYSEGWATSQTSDGAVAIPLWPEKEYAERCIGGEWANYEPRSIDLDEVLEDMIPFLRRANVAPGVFFDPSTGSIQVTVDELERDLRTELERYT